MTVRFTKKVENNIRYEFEDKTNKTMKLKVVKDDNSSSNRG